MRFLKNRIIVSFIVIFALTYFWEFYVRPVTAPIYARAVSEYRKKNYARSLELLAEAYNNIDANDANVVTLIGWNYLKLGRAQDAEPYFRRSHRLAPRVLDTVLGYAYTEIALKKYEAAAALLKLLMQRGMDTADVRVAWGALYRDQGHNREAAREFRIALSLERDNAVAVKNLREIYNVSGDVRQVSLDYAPLRRAKDLTYPARVEGEHLAWQAAGGWSPAYLAGVNLTPALPGHFPADAPTESNLYAGWLEKISDLGANTIRVYTILSPAFYRALFEFNHTPSHKPLRLVQGIFLDNPPEGDFFNRDYYEACRKEIRDTIDVIHGQGDVSPTYSHPGGIYTSNLAAWVTGFLIGQAWPSHVVAANNRLHPDIQTYQGTYVEVPSGNPTEIFLAQMINYAAEYEEGKYNWQHPAAFLNWPPLDPLSHPTESTALEEAVIRRNLGERFPFPGGTYDDDDSISLDPTHVHARERFPAGYFAAYSVYPFYPDFINLDPGYQQARDAEGSNPFLGYLEDLKAHHRGLPLLISDYEVPTSLGIGHFSPAGFDQGGETETQQGLLLARFTRNIHEAGAAGGLVFEWVDEWFRQTWPVHKFETPAARKPLWANFMDPAEYYGLLAAEPHRRAIHLLGGEAAEWANIPPFYAALQHKRFRAAGDRYDPARDLKVLYLDADEGFLYLRLVVGKLDNDNDGQPDWKNVNYVIGISTAPGRAGLTRLPYVAPLRFPMGMTYAVHLAGPQSSQILIASSYNPYQVIPVVGIPNQTILAPKLGWQSRMSDTGIFEPQLIEPNRRRFARDGRYFPPERYDRGILRYGSLNPRAPDYNSLAEWHANVHTNSIDLRIPWNLLNVTDPSTYKIFAGLEKDGTVDTTDTSGFLVVAFSYRPLEISRLFPVMEQDHPIADALPGMAGPDAILAAALKEYRWMKWDSPQYDLRLKDSYAILRKAFLQLPRF